MTIEVEATIQGLMREVATLRAEVERPFVNRDGYIRAEVTISERVSIGPFVQLVTDNHDLGPATQRAGRLHTVPITVGDASGSALGQL